MDCVHEKGPLGKPGVYSKLRTKVVIRLKQVLVSKVELGLLGNHGC